MSGGWITDSSRVSHQSLSKSHLEAKSDEEGHWKAHNPVNFLGFVALHESTKSFSQFPITHRIFKKVRMLKEGKKIPRILPGITIPISQFWNPIIWEINFFVRQTQRNLETKPAWNDLRRFIIYLSHLVYWYIWCRNSNVI